MTQSRLQSFIEAGAGTILGFVMSMGLSAIVYPAFGHAFTLAQNFWIVTIFTVASVVRGHLVRRFFNRLHRGAK